MVKHTQAIAIDGKLFDHAESTVESSVSSDCDIHAGKMVVVQVMTKK